jgi:lactoylglutathione lyase
VAELEGVSHVGIHVRDLERSLAFYEGLLGFDLVARWTRDDEYVRQLVGYPGATLEIGILRFPGSPLFLEIIEYRDVERRAVDTATANPGTAHVCLYVRDLDALHRRLTAAGVEFVSEPASPTTGPNVGGKVVYALDPDGIRIELAQTARTPAGEPRS